MCSGKEGGEDGVGVRGADGQGSVLRLKGEESVDVSGKAGGVEVSVAGEWRRAARTEESADKEVANYFKVWNWISQLSQASLKLREPSKTVFKFDQNKNKDKHGKRYIHSALARRASDSKSLFMVSPQFMFQYFPKADIIDQYTTQTSYVISSGSGEQLTPTEVQYDPLNFMNSWAVMGPFNEDGERVVDLHFVPVANHADSVSRVFGEAARIHVAYGFWQGHIIHKSERIELEGLAGIAIKINKS